MNILIVLTSHDTLGDTGEKTGFWLEEFTSPYYRLLDSGATITLASPKGGQAPIDPKSDDDDSQTETTRRFHSDAVAQNVLANTHKLSAVEADQFDAIFYPGGHGPLWDLATDAKSIKLIETFTLQDKPVAAVCHGPAVFANTKNQDGSPLVKGKKVTGFSNSEEEAAGLTEVVPFLIETMFEEAGAHYEKTDDWQSHVVEDGLLITGQNPASSDAVAEALVLKLRALK